MLASLALLASLLAPQGPASVVINEFQYHDSGIDDREFVELYNRSTQPVDISGWTLESESAAGPNPSYTIPKDTTLPAGRYWVIGAATVPNVDQVVGTNDLWMNGGASLTLRDSQGMIVDTLVYEMNKVSLPLWNVSLVEGQGVWGDFLSVDGIETSWQRLRDGFDTDDNGVDFRVMPQTPGTSNDVRNNLPYLALFESQAVGAAVKGFGGTFALGTVIDPATADQANPNVIPPSPQGGHAAVLWDPQGGGNSNMLLTDAVQDVIFEAWVYFDAELAPNPKELQSWSIGLRGTTCSYYNFPDPGNTLGSHFVANGNTGVSFTYQVTNTAAMLYLVDHNDGGIDFTVLDQIQISKGVNDGWQRLRLMVVGDRVEGFLGGSFGCGDGKRVGGRLTKVVPGGIYVGYRHSYANASLVRPLTCDFMIIREASPALEFFGNAVATNSGTPDIDVIGLPVIGFPGFGIALRGLVPSQTSFVIMGTSRLTPPIDLQALGGQVGSQMLVTPLLILGATVDASGEARLMLPIPCSNAFIGSTIYWQDFDLDKTLAVVLPLGNSQGMATTFTN